MADKLLIVHGYSDGSTSFTGLGEFFIARGAYKREHVFYLDYSSMDDDATFHDFADKLDYDHRTRLGTERVDVACHSTGSLVVRAWLALHAERVYRRSQFDRTADATPCPVHRLLCFAPANFGSDLAAMGQSYLGKFRTTFFNSNSYKKEDFLESGKVVLRGLEPASPFQWDLSWIDLHSERSYFSPTRPEHQRCYPFVFAAGEAYGGIEAKLVKQRGAAGTDGTVRIAGTSLNTEACTLDFRESGTRFVWWPRRKHAVIPWSVFPGVNHGSIIDPKHEGFEAPTGPGTMALEALKVQDLAGYQAIAPAFEANNQANYAKLPADRRDAYQQFFFVVRDDVGMIVEDYYIDFFVSRRSDNSAHRELTLFFDEQFETHVTRHSTTPSHRVFLMNCSRLEEFWKRLIDEDAQLMIEVTGKSPLPDVKYAQGTFVAFDPKGARGQDEPWLLRKNSTTLVDVVLNREQADKLLVVKDCSLVVVVETPSTAAAPLSGRAELVAAEKQG